MNKTFLLTTILLFSLNTILAQDIVNKLGGTTATETYDVTDSADNILLRVQGDGKVGIGTASPSEVLDIDGNLVISGTVDGIDIATDVTANTAKVTDDDDGVAGAYGVGWNADTDSPTKDAVYDKIETISDGWHGSITRIKILPSDFMSIETNWAIFNDDDRNSAGVEGDTDNEEMWVFVPIPTGYKATHVKIFGSNTTTVTYTIDEGNLATGVMVLKGSSTNVGTEIDITDVNSSTTNYLAIHINTATKTDRIYGGYVTIASI